MNFINIDFLFKNVWLKLWDRACGLKVFSCGGALDQYFPEINKLNNQNLTYNEHRLSKMRNSPINYLRHGRDPNESPYQSMVQRSAQRESPQRVISNLSAGDAEYWRQRAKSLETSILGLNEQLNYMEGKLHKIDQLEDKIQVLLAQNSHLVQENQDLIKLVQQKKSEAEMWRSRFQGEYTNSNLAQAQKKQIFDHLSLKDHEYQVQMDKLLSEISRLQDQKIEMEGMKQIEINALKNRCENEAMAQIQNLKRSQYGNTELQELNIRKLRDQIEEKGFQIQNVKRDGKLEAERFGNEVNFLKNQIKKIEQQKEHELDLLKAQNDNQRNNQLRAHRKNQQQLKNLHEGKVRRLTGQIQERKNEIQECYGKLRKGGKENEAQLNQMVNQKSKLRQEMRDGQNSSRQRVTQLMQFYENQICQLRNSCSQREENLIKLYDSEISSLTQIINAKQEEIQRLLDLNLQIKRNQERRLGDIKGNNQQLKAKIYELIMHYEREVQLMKIKISELYEADLDSLRSGMQNRLGAHERERDNLRGQLQESREILAKEIQDRLDLRIDYENRLNMNKLVHEREHQQFQDLLASHGQELKNQTSKFSLTYIEHNDKLQKEGQSKKEMMAEIRTLQKQLASKNKELEALNLKMVKNEAMLRKQVKRLEEDSVKGKDQHQVWIERQDRENLQWNKQRAELKEQAHGLNMKMQDGVRKARQAEEDLVRKLEEKRLEIAGLNGTVEELEKKCGEWKSKHGLEVSHIEKTQLQTQALMNNQKTKLTDTRDRELQVREDQGKRVLGTFRKEMDELKRENDVLRDNNAKGRIREQELSTEVTNLLDSVNKRNTLEEHVINIGLSNNYFKNVAEIFRKQIQPLEGLGERRM